MNKTFSEFDFIAKYLKPLAWDNSASFSLGNDVALIKPRNGYQFVTSKDLFVENVHFLSKDNPRDIASRLLLSNISDIASSGAIPKYYMLGLPKRKDLMNGFYDEFCHELQNIQNEHNISLIGGDTVGTNNDLFFSVTIFGEADSDKLLLRSSAEIGDEIFVTGTVGDSYLGLQYKLDNSVFSELNSSEINYLLNCHNKPSIAYQFAHEIAANNVTKTAIDISDGLLADLNHICIESNVSAKINLDQVPISNIAQKVIGSRDYTIQDLITGGEDFQLLLTTNKGQKNNILTIANRHNISLNSIGEVISKSSNNIELISNIAELNNLKLNTLGYEH